MEWRGLDRLYRAQVAADQRVYGGSGIVHVGTLQQLENGLNPLRRRDFAA
jgi:hypothetical protein